MSTEAIVAPIFGHYREREKNLHGLPDEELVKLAQLGCRNASERLMCLYGSTVRSAASRYFLLGAEREDVIQEGFVGLCSAIRNYSASSNRSFHNFAFVCVTRQIQTAVRAARRAKHSTLNCAASLRTDDAGSSPIFEEGAGRQSMSDDVSDLMSEFCSGLTDFESAVLRGLASGQSYLDISVRLGCPLKAVDNGLQRAKRKILVNRSG
jgi:RNA polymerase sporulation-specific sigma factor